MGWRTLEECKPKCHAPAIGVFETSSATLEKKIKPEILMTGSEEHSGMKSLIAPVLEPLALGLEFFGIGVIVIGVVVASVVYLKDSHATSAEMAYTRYRANLGRGILLGLEILIGADIIATIISPLTWDSVGLLGFVVIIRTFLSFSLEAEIDGEWPWRRKARESQKRPSTR